MTERRRQPARLREFARIRRELATLKARHEAVMERRNKLLLDDAASEDPSSNQQLADALGYDVSTIKVTFTRLRKKLTG